MFVCHCLSQKMMQLLATTFSCSAQMFLRAVFFWLPLSVVWCHVPSKTLNATIGGSVVIPCSLSTPPASLEWFYWQEEKSTKTVYHWNNKTKAPGDPSYVNRTHIFSSQLNSGNISVKLDKVVVEDDQDIFWAVAYVGDGPEKYPGCTKCCNYMLQVNAPYQNLIMTLDSAANRVFCTAHSGYPKSTISWKGVNQSGSAQLDLRGDETIQEDPVDRTFMITSSVDMEGLQSVTCLVHCFLSHLSTSRTMKLRQDVDQPKYLGFLLLLLIPAGIGIWWKCNRMKNPEGKQSESGQRRNTPYNP